MEMMHLSSLLGLEILLTSPQEKNSKILLKTQNFLCGCIMKLSGAAKNK